MHTYRSISSFRQDSMARSGCQRLSTCYDAFGTVDSTPSTGKRDKVRVQSGINSVGVERHFEDK
jgi:hypothetical protein